MELTPAAIDAYKKLLTSPAEYGFFDYKPIREFFQESEEVTAKHTLAEAYIKHINRPLPKVVLYIIMDEIYGQCVHKDKNGNLGYKLKQL